jgi:hypothetical protein
MTKSDTDLLAQIEATLLPLVSCLNLRVIDHSESGSFDNASVTLEGGDLRLRILRERSQVFVDLGPAWDPQSSFDSAVFMDCLGLSDDAGFHDRDAGAVMRGLGSFLRSFADELRNKFSRANFAVTKAELTTLRNARPAARLGFENGGGAA